MQTKVLQKESGMLVKNFPSVNLHKGEKGKGKYSFKTNMRIQKRKCKSKVHPRTVHEGTEGE